MSFRKPVHKARDLVRRFGLLEDRVAGLTARQDELCGRLDRYALDHQEQLAALLADVRAMADELRESVHLVAARSAFQRTQTRVLFLVHHIEAWDSCAGLFWALDAAPDFEAIVATLPRYFRGMDGFGYEEEVHRQLAERGVPHIRLGEIDDAEALRLIKAIDPDLVFRQSQWDPDVPGYAATDRLTFARLCLVPYETMNLVENVPFAGQGSAAVDHPYHRAAWAVFCANDMVKDMAVEQGSRAGEQFHVTGHPKADHLRSAARRWPLARSAETRARVVWSAHHSIGTGWSDFGAFHLMADDMLRWAAEEPEIEFVFMPHPALLPYLHAPESPWSGPQLAEWRARWEALPNAVVFTDGDYVPLLRAADLVITDGLSMLVEPQVVGLPVVFFERDGHRPFNRIGEVVRTGVHATASMAQLRAVTAELLAGPDPLAARQEEVVERLFGPAGSVDRIVAVLREKIADERRQAANHPAAELRSPNAAATRAPAPAPPALFLDVRPG
jgi:hypothetical protein